MIDLILTSVLVGLLYCLFTIGLSISFRVINYPDLTLEGSAILGGALCFNALHFGLDPFTALLVGFVGGALAGVFTGILYLYANVSKLLSGIITTAILYSLNIRFLGGKSNVRLTDENTVFTLLNPSNASIPSILILSAFVILILCILFFVFRLRVGYLLRILGDNEKFINTLGRNPNKFTLIGLGLSNGIIGLGGALMVQYKNTCDINMSFGLLVGALAALMLGESIFSAKSIFRHFTFSVVGTVLYSLVIGFVLFSWSSDWEKYVMASDVRLFTGLLLIALAVFTKFKKTGKVSLFNSHW
ncbi:MAG: hypothetical protein HYY40_14085 [Bacteroidetes bacterium]|nr:hypothetical protein [Bacteroidota bacterium]